MNRNAAKLWWTNGYKNWDDSQFKHRVRVSRETFELMLQRIEIYIVKEPTNMVHFPIEPHRQLGITLYRCAHEYTFSTVADDCRCHLLSKYLRPFRESLSEIFLRNL